MKTATIHMEAISTPAPMDRTAAPSSTDTTASDTGMHQTAGDAMIWTVAAHRDSRSAAKKSQANPLWIVLSHTLRKIFSRSL